MTQSRKTQSQKQPGLGFDIQNMLSKMGIEFQWPGYQYMDLTQKWLKLGDPVINLLDKIAKQHNVDYSPANNLQDKWKVDTYMIKAIDRKNHDRKDC